jgi:hypothetical protein
VKVNLSIADANLWGGLDRAFGFRLFLLRCRQWQRTTAAAEEQAAANTLQLQIPLCVAGGPE